MKIIVYSDCGSRFYYKPTTATKKTDTVLKDLLTGIENKNNIPGLVSKVYSDPKFLKVFKYNTRFFNLVVTPDGYYNITDEFTCYPYTTDEFNKAYIRV